ncbi:MAG: methyltransferase [Proteobacteria bacterium]|nr:methyltransferase [Pseudomonadota bacterium]
MADVSLDRLLGGRVALAQPTSGYRAAIDPVLLAAAVDAATGDTVIDLGCGVGAAALCLMQRVPGALVTGVDRDADMVALARDNAARNGRAGFTVLAADILAAPAALTDLPPADHVLTNPPFHAADASDPSPDPARARATIAGFALGDWLAHAAARLGPRGALTVIHRADRLDDVLAALPEGFGGIAVVPLWPRAGAPAKRVIVAATKGSRAPVTLTAGLVLHRPDGGYTAEADTVLRDGAGLGAVVAGLWPARARRRVVAPAS